MIPILLSKPSDCRNCYKCIRNCPVKSIRFSGDQASIMEDECILCGQCYNTCPQDAKKIRNDLDTAKIMLMENETVVASIAPSFAAYYPGVSISGIRKTLKKLGFSYVEETATGAALVAKKYDDLMSQRTSKVIISSCCPSVNILIQKHYPQVLPFLARVLTPIQAHCSVIKSNNNKAKTIFFSPCIAKKLEADENDKLDLSLTFEDLDNWLEEEGILIEPAEDDNNQGGRSRLFPTTGGILRTLAENSEYTYYAIDGVNNCISALKDIAEGNLDKCFIEMSACSGSCVGGPMMIRKKKMLVRSFMSVTKYAKDVDFPVSDIDIDFSRDYPYLGKSKIAPGKHEIISILKQMGKNKLEDELNCGGCGYNTCQEKAVAVYQGKANYTMCLPYLKEKAESFSDNIIRNTPNSIIVLNESLEIQQINKSALKMMNISSQNFVMGEHVVRIMDPSLFLNVLESKRGMSEKKIYLAEYEKYVEMTILYDKSYHILICIMRDITKEEKLREKRDAISKKTIETADHVVEKQMRIVQEIASLLGETTAETKIALTKLKESLSDE